MKQVGRALKYGPLLLLLCPFNHGLLGASTQKPVPTETVLDEIQKSTTDLNVWWMGHNGWLIKSGDLLISTDLVLEDPGRLQPPPISAEQLAGKLDISFVTHWHGDHFHEATSKVLLEKSDCIFVMPKSCLETARRLKIPESRIRVAIPKEPFEIEGIEVLPIRAIHGNRRFAVYDQANFDDCGYRLSIGGKTFLQPGDSVLLEDQLFLEHVDVLFFSPTIHNTHIDRSVILINTLEPDYILPQHRDTYRQTPENRFWTNGYAYEVRELLSKSLQQRYQILQIGERLEIRSVGESER